MPQTKPIKWIVLLLLNGVASALFMIMLNSYFSKRSYKKPTKHKK